MEKSEQILGIQIKGTNLFIRLDDPNYLRVKEKWGKTHKIEPVLGGEEVDLTKLADNESVCAGDGERYYFLLTKIKQ